MTTYRPQDHAAALEEWTQIVSHQARASAVMHGKIDRILHAILKSPAVCVNAPGLDRLIQAAFVVMGSSTWSSSDLIGQTLKRNSENLELLQAIEASCSATARSLGKFLAGAIPGQHHITADGLEIRRNGVDSKVLVWSISEV
jgi:hypothetical protein